MAGQVLILKCLQRCGISYVVSAPLFDSAFFWAACHYACSAGSREIVLLLAAHGANLDARTKRSKSTPLHLAAKRYLIDFGVCRWFEQLGQAASAQS